jgi:hypothetical protein
MEAHFLVVLPVGVGLVPHQRLVEILDGLQARVP